MPAGIYALLLLLAALGLNVPLLHAQDGKPGLIQVRSVQTELDEGVYLLDARLQYILSDEARAALESGVPLVFTIDIEVKESRRLWLDDTEAALAVVFELQYHALSQRYLVRNNNSGEQESFATVYSALNNLGRITDLPVIDDALLNPSRAHRVMVRATLEFQDYSGPLRLLAFWLEDWHLQSDWYQWPLSR